MGQKHNNLHLAVAIFTSWMTLQALPRQTEGAGTNMPVARSPKLLKYYADLEISFVDKLRKIDQEIYVNDPTLRELVQRYVTDFANATEEFYTYKGSLTSKVSAMTAHPLAVYRMIWRLATILPDIRAAEPETDNLDDFLHIFTHFPEDTWLCKDDLQDAMMGIFRVQHTYDLDTRQLADGVIAGHSSGIVLRAIHCFEIGKYASATNHTNLAIEWLEVAKEKAAEDLTANISDIDEALEAAIENHDSSHVEADVRQHSFFDQKLGPIRHLPNYKSLRRRNRQLAVEKYLGDPSVPALKENYWAHCTNALYNVSPRPPKPDLFCWRESKSHPYWYIGPLKMELLATNPDLLQIYDFIEPQKTQEILDLAARNLFASTVINVKGKKGDSTRSPIRTSVQSWLDEQKFPQLSSLLHKIYFATGLYTFNETSGDHLQVAGYTFSGHYEAHVDALREYDIHGETKGDRIGTFMLYLVEPELGGYTAFTTAGVSAKPIKGSAVFWYNLYKDGSADYTTYHGACPVVLGTKWVANKWIRLYDQFRLRKCGLKPQESHRIIPFQRWL